VGAALLGPPVRAAVRVLCVRRLQRRSRVVVATTRARPGRRQPVEVWDVESWEDSAGDGGAEGSGPAEIGGPR
jgi:hypothetical protein